MFYSSARARGVHTPRHARNLSLATTPSQRGEECPAERLPCVRHVCTSRRRSGKRGGTRSLVAGRKEDPPESRRALVVIPRRDAIYLALPISLPKDRRESSRDAPDSGAGRNGARTAKTRTLAAAAAEAASVFGRARPPPPIVDARRVASRARPRLRSRGTEGVARDYVRAEPKASRANAN